MLSICIPTYKRSAMLAELLESIVAQGASASELEVVISDDASGDDTPEVMARYAARLPNVNVLVQQRNQGFCKNCLAVVSAAKGEHVWIVGDDDRLEQGSVRAVIAAIAAHPGIAGMTLGSVDYDAELKSRIGLKRMPTTGLMTSAEEVFARVGDQLGYMSILVVHRETWQTICKQDTADSLFKLYIHVHIVGRMLRIRPRWLVLDTSCVHYRSDNDQFMKQLGWYDRLALDVQGYHTIANDLFGEGAASARAFESRVFYAHVLSRLVGGRSGALTGGIRWKIFNLLVAHYFWLPAFWLTAPPLLLLPREVIGAVRSLYQSYVPFSGKRRAKELSN